MRAACSVSAARQNDTQDGSSSVVLIGYEWISNLGEEIRLFWNGKVTAATMLYFPIRYLVIAYWAMCYPEVLLRGVVSKAFPSPE